MRLAAIALALAAAVLPARAHAWGSIRGNGQKVTEARTVEPFDAIELAGSLDVDVKVGPAQSVAVTIDQNLLPEVETKVEHRTLRVSQRHDITHQGQAKVTVTVPALARLEISGSGNGLVQGAQGGDARLSVSGSGDVRWSGQAGRLEVEIEGSGDMTLSGRAEALSVAISGAGNVAARDLSARSAEVSVDGSGNVDLTLAGGTLDATVSGSGDVHWRGEAQVRRAAVSGSGEISRR